MPFDDEEDATYSINAHNSMMRNKHEDNKIDHNEKILGTHGTFS
jgi:hypothetical protein